MKCFVKPCRNYSHQGNFSGQVCIPCLYLAQDIKKGKLKRSYNFEEKVIQFIADNWEEIIKRGHIFYPESTHHIYIGPGKPYKIHIVNVFRNIYKDNLVIYRWYGKHKQWWHYTMEREEVLKIKISQARK